MALIIKSLSVDPPNYDDLSDDENDFVKDPAQYRDQLPQPYRYIDELLRQFLDEVWEDVTHRENERVAEKSKTRPPKYECAVHLQELSNLKALVSSEDGRHLFAGYSGGIHLLNASTKQLISSYEDERLDVTMINCTIIGVELYLLSTIDEQGVCRLFGCCAEKILLMKIVNEDATTINHHTIRCQVSQEGDYMGLLLENPSSGETALEVHALPHTWCKELEELKIKFIKDGDKVAPQSPAPQEATMEESVDAPLVQSQALPDGAELPDGNKSVESAGSRRGAPMYKFSTSYIVMKQNPPPKVSPNVGPSAAAMLAGFPDVRSVIGTGQNNMLTKQYLEVRNEAFRQMHAGKLVYKSPETDDKCVECTFHFFTPGLMIPYGIEQPGATKKPISVGVWWTAHRLFSLYCLTKPVKVKKTDTGEGELYLKAESVWPQADIITASAIIPDSCLVALGLRNGMVTIWDKQLSVMRKSVTISESPIIAIRFLDPSICPQFNNRQQCYSTSTSCYALIQSANSTVSLLNCGMLDMGPTITISGPAMVDDEKLTQILLFPSRLPEILLKIHKDGRMFLQDLITAQVLCEVSLPSPYKLNTPWSPTISISAYGQILYVQGVADSIDENGERVQRTSLHAFQLRSFMTLDKYWSRARIQTPYTSLTSIDQRVSALLTHRIKISGRRKQRLQERWPLMKHVLNRIVSLRTH